MFLPIYKAHPSTSAYDAHPFWTSEEATLTKSPNPLILSFSIAVSPQPTSKLKSLIQKTISKLSSSGITLSNLLNLLSMVLSYSSLTL